MTAQNASSPPRAAVVVNPAKSVGADLRASLVRLCDTQGWAEPLWLETTVEDPGVGQAREALEAGVDVVIAAGGDGTVRCVAEALAGTDTPMGMVPLGTGNLLARNMGVDISDPVSAAYDVLNGTVRTIDVARATFDGSGDENVFLVMAGVGYDAAIMADTVDALKDRMGWLAYVEAGIRKLPGKPVRATVKVDGKHPVKRRIRSVMAGNCGRIMGGIEIFPEAKIDDGILDLLILAPRGALRLAGRRGRHLRPQEERKGIRGILPGQENRGDPGARGGVPGRRRPRGHRQEPVHLGGSRGAQSPDVAAVSPRGACPTLVRARGSRQVSGSATE
jgi:diacylglycerol kinase (ATP)